MMSARGVASRLASSYVSRARLLDYWSLQDTALQAEFQRGDYLLSIEGRPLVTKDASGLYLVSTSYNSLQKHLHDFGLRIDATETCLIDVLDNASADPRALFGLSLWPAAMPSDSPIGLDDVLAKLGRQLQARFVSTRTAILTMDSEQERQRLARFATLSKWASTYKRCPRCAHSLRMRLSKTAAECVHCSKFFYPTFSPVAITIVTSPDREHLMLVRHRGSLAGIYTAVAGFSVAGEPLHETARREIAEEVGIEVTDVRGADASQAWPLPDSSLMVGFVATAPLDSVLDPCVNELETARWFRRDEVAAAYERTCKDLFLKGISRDASQRQEFRYIPPRGAIAHQLIRRWLAREL